MLLVGRSPYRFVVGFNEQLFQRINLETASGNLILQLFFLIVNTVIPMQWQLHLTFLKDENLNM